MASQVRVGRLRVRAGRRDAAGRPDAAGRRDAAARLRAEALLEALDIGRAARPDRSVLVVRQLRLCPPRGPGTAPQALRRQAHDQLDELRRRAVRPAYAGLAADDCEAVLFADEAELLACVTVDALAGQIGARWYWHRLLPAAGTTSGAVTAAWTERARWLPRAASLLSTSARQAAVALLDAGQARAVLQAVLAELRGTAAAAVPFSVAVRAVAVTAAPGRDGRDAAGDISARPAARSGTGPGAAGGLPPWAGRVPAAETAALPTPAHQALAGVLGVAAAAPAAAAGAAFGERVLAWLAERPPAGLAPDAVAAGGLATAWPTGAPGTWPAAVAGQAQPGIGVGGTRPDAPWLATLAAAQDGQERRVRSGFASVFYLVNLVVRLGLFEPALALAEPGALPEPATGWALLELLARALLAPDQIPPDDPLWAVLADPDRPAGPGPAGLAGRSGSAGGSGPPGPGPWPAATLRTVREQLAQLGIAVAALATPGWITITRTHVDVSISIDAIDLAVRAAGLDRDPGWVPPLGRVIAFHFDEAA